MEMTEETFNEALRWNVTTAFNLAQLATPHLLESDHAAIVFTSSTSGSNASRGFMAYGTGKASLMKLTRHLAMDLAPKIRVNTVSPAPTLTENFDAMFDDRIKGEMASMTPLQKIGTVEDIAAATLFLASDAGGHITGRDLRVDGGIEAMSINRNFADLVHEAEAA
jgi:7-alpha-hydroxysteroid dehydrogenase